MQGRVLQKSDLVEEPGQEQFTESTQVLVKVALLHDPQEVLQVDDTVQEAHAQDSTGIHEATKNRKITKNKKFDIMIE